MKMEAGNRIRLDVGCHRMYRDLQDFYVEEFRFCLGIFLSEDHREAGRFTPLCNLYEAGPKSESKYISNFGEYITNEVPAFMQITSNGILHHWEGGTKASCDCPDCGSSLVDYKG